MVTKKDKPNSRKGGLVNSASSPVEELLMAALERGDDSAQTGRYLITYKNGSGEAALKSLQTTQGMRVADARDFDGQAITLESAGDADAVFLPEIGVALVGSNAAQERGMGIQSDTATNSLIESIDPEYFTFTDYSNQNFAERTQGSTNEFLRGFQRAAQMISQNWQPGASNQQVETEEDAQVVGATWGLIACKVPPSVRSGMGIKVAVLDTGFDLGHPDFVGRPVVSATFVGQPVQDLNGHGTHMIGTACGPKAPAGTIPRYGIGFRSSIFVAKILSNSGSSVGGSVLAGMNWAIANRCPVILAAVGGPGGPQPAYTAAGQAALTNGCLIIAAAGSSGSSVGAPANSPTIMSVGAVGKTLQPTPFSPIGKIELVGPGVDILSSYPRPRLYQTWSGSASATAHIAGCAALWAETSPDLRGQKLWRKLLATAKPLPFPRTRVGAGLVQAP
ncbi:S8 family serine peptidase [Spirosoma fluviale]|uniref:Serine protease, subtilisin family n=1 Tax=Spirosoma fluviale TaxID=1597977 RepID=A0A286G4W1_9BACT|nr:S8 family serine peptidase [Spirosoma fluviale]SOD90571.1 Serine protease, subtilisin family [Spirosoma fluviale]